MLRVNSPAFCRQDLIIDWLLIREIVTSYSELSIPLSAFDIKNEILDDELKNEVDLDLNLKSSEDD